MKIAIYPGFHKGTQVDGPEDLAHGFDGEEKASFSMTSFWGDPVAFTVQSSGRDDGVDVGMKHQVLSPGM